MELMRRLVPSGPIQKSLFVKPKKYTMASSIIVWRVCDFCLIIVPFGHYDEPEIFPYAIRLICPIGADVRQSSKSEVLGGWRK